VRFRVSAAMTAIVSSVALAGAGSAQGAPPAAFNPVVEAQNFSITLERQAIYDTPAYQEQLTVDSAANTASALAAEAADPSRLFSDDLCFNQANGCAGDIRLDDWAAKGYGLVRPVLFTARDGATISGHVWAIVSDPTHPTAKRPGIVITDGSVQADEQMYWYLAQTLAKDGYVVLTFDPQGQGQSDTPGASPDSTEGVPAQTDGRPFYDGTEDAIDFLESSPAHPYEPVPSCSTGTSHAAKQDARVKAGLDTAYDPFSSLLDGSDLGLVGHSYGAAGVSYIAQWDPRVKAVVALDNLGGPGPNAGSVPVGGVASSPQSSIGEQSCPADPADRTTVPITKPGLGLSADYGLPATPNSTLPAPGLKEQESLAYTKAGVDSGEIVIRGGSHVDFSFIPNQAFGASLRGPDLTDWYASAWFDKYLKHQASADARLLSQRWRSDATEAAVDPGHDGNAFSFYYQSRLDIGLARGGRFDCEDLRDGCAGMVAASSDGYPGTYSYAAIDTTPDAVHGSGSALKPGSGLTACRARWSLRLRARKGVTRVKVYLDGKLVRTERGRSVTVPSVAGTGRHTVRLVEYKRKRMVKRVTRHVYGCAHRR
jgi:dienelactone hydrolase